MGLLGIEFLFSERLQHNISSWAYVAIKLFSCASLRSIIRANHFLKL